GYQESDYTFRWEFEGAIVASSSAITDKRTGTYTLFVENTTTGCTAFKEFILVPQQAIIALATSKSDLTTCAPLNGMAAVTSVTVDGATESDLSNFTFSWFGSGYQPMAGTSSEQTGLAAGTYHVVATHTGLGCSSDMATIIIKDERKDPILTFEAAKLNSSCDPATPNGSLSYRADGEDHFNTDYSFEWSFQGNVISNEYEITGLAEGYYTLKVLNKITNCTNSRENIYLGEDPATISILNVDLVHSSNCTPKENGTATVSIIQIDNIDDDIANYDFTWYDVANVQFGGQSNAEINLKPGKYFVTAAHKTLKCISVTYPFEIKKESIAPVLVIVQERPNTGCANDILNGSLLATADNINSTNTNYTFTWYAGKLPISVPAIASGRRLDNRGPGFYTVAVKNETTGCVAYQVGEIEDRIEENKPEILEVSLTHPKDCNASGKIEIIKMKSGNLNDYEFIYYEGTYSPGQGEIIHENPYHEFLLPGIYYIVAYNTTTKCRSLPMQIELYDESTAPELYFNDSELLTQQSCDPFNPNGAVEAYATNWSQNTNRFSFTWYEGQGISAAQKMSQTAPKITGLKVGFYTVEILDNITQCKTSGSYFVREYVPGPVIDVTFDPNTNCDPLKANGKLRATADLTTTNHTFKWYKGEFVVGDVISTLAAPTQGLSSGFYTVHAVDNYSQCESAYTIFLEEEIEIVPIPELLLVSHNDNCNSNNGQIAASINGSDLGYDFNLYFGEIVTGTPIVNNGNFEGLAAGTYSVTATDKITGCTSDKATIIVEEHKEYPKFSFKTRNSSCKEDNGSATIIVEPGMEIESITVESGSVFRNGPKATDLPAGEYTVTVTTSQGCATTASLSIGLDVHVYNGFSPNGDGKNDKWVIGCLEDFPQNKVRVFNRTGALVYEGLGYNNNDIYFEGLGNRGIYIGSPKLPDGTYFYIIERNDGSKPMTGYIELIR
nr:gliding motility-associated C-terminal domain-containing protein [Bacteroidota bacterium]